MISYIDEALKLWAAELHPPAGEQALEAGGCASPLATLIRCKGELIRSTAGSRVLLRESAEIELIVNKLLPFEEHQVVIEHYTNYDSLEHQRYEACGCSRAQFYRRLHKAHESIRDCLITRKRAA